MNYFFVAMSLLSLTTVANAGYEIDLQSVEYVAKIAADGSLKKEIHVRHNSCSKRNLSLDTSLLETEGLVAIVDESNIDCRAVGIDRVYTLDTTGLKLFKLKNYLTPSFEDVK